jgi:hypothetical protein
MKLNSYHRAIVGYLADIYGVGDAKIVPPGTRGQSHPVLAFTYAGEPRQMQVHASGGTHNRDPLNLLALKKQDLRRMLGPAPSSIQPRSDQEIVTVEPNQDSPAMEAKPFNPLPLSSSRPKPSRSWEVGIAAYEMTHDKVNLRLFLPADLIEAWGDVPGCVIERIGEEDWRIRKDRYSERKPRLHKSQKDYALQQPSPAERCFGRSPAEAVIVDDSLLIHASLADRRWSQAVVHFKPEEPALTRSLEREVEREGHFAGLSAGPDRHDPIKPTDKQVAIHPRVAIAITTEAMRACLEEIRRIERSCPYRLVKIAETKAWAFSAPRIE